MQKNAKKIKNPSILIYKGQEYFLLDLIKKSNGFSKAEAEILKCRISGEAIGNLSEDDFRHATDQMILRGAAIYGFDLPPSEGFAQTLTSEIMFFIDMFDGYGNLCVEEIMLAMHFNANGAFRDLAGDYVERVEFSGKTFNVMFLAKVLRPYMGMRHAIDKKLQNQIEGY